MTLEALSAVAAAIPNLRGQLAIGHKTLRRNYETHPVCSQLLQGRVRLVDNVISQLWQLCEMPETLALAATGGYGRGELYPHSDIDLLILLPTAADAVLQARLSEFVSALWDVGLEIGQSVRTVDECIAAAAQDITIHTNLLEARQITGSRALFETFTAASRAAMDVEAFFTAKLLEQQQRHARFQETPFALEPNCKESPGGLRDLHLVGWIARAAGFGQSWRELARKRLIDSGEALVLRRVERFLQHLRIRLHFLTGRAEDRILFDHQEALARAMGIEANAAKRASEVLMQRYYRIAQQVTQITPILLANYRAEVLGKPGSATFVINERFQSQRDLLDIRRPDVFEKTPSALFECFLIVQQRSELTGMTARTLRALWRHRNQINTAFRADPHNRELFLSILQQRRGVLHVMRGLNHYGLLSRYIPAWRRVFCQMQHDLFHVYTVDQHTLMVLRNLRRFSLGEHAHEYPLMTRLANGFDKMWLLYLAALFHDIGKGRGGDHSLLGKEDAREFCLRHELPAEDRDLVVWLVEHHLKMSLFAQKRDISDPEVISEFAALVGDEYRLEALYLLTHADIRGTSPKVWNGWRAKLLEDLFFATQRLLRGATPEQAVRLDDRQLDVQRLLRYHGLRPGVETELWRQLDPVYFMRHSAEEIAWHTRVLHGQVTSTTPIVRARVAEEQQGLQVMVYTPDQKDLFLRLTGSFGRLGFSIVDAKIHTTRHGYALDSFFIHDTTNQASYRDVVQYVEHELVQALLDTPAPARPPSGRLSRQVRHFPIAPQVSVRPDETSRHFILSVTAADRPGLLFAIAEVLVEHGIALHAAKIVTLGERAEDVFLLDTRGLEHERDALRLEQALHAVLAH